MRDGVLHMLAGRPDLDVVDVGADYDEAYAAVERHRPDVLLTDIRMPATRTDEGIRLAEHCRRSHPQVGVLLRSQYLEPSYVRVLLARGAEGRGYLLKERVASAGDLVDALRAVARCDSAFDPKVVESFVCRDGRAPAISAWAGSARASATCSPPSRRGAPMRPWPTTSYCPRRPFEKHINSIFDKLGLAGDQQHHPGVRAALLHLSEGRS